MSVETEPSERPDPTVDDGAPATLGCSLCDRSLDGVDDLFVQLYPEADQAVPDVATGDGFLAVCAACAPEVDELVDAWTGHADPPVGADHSIAGGYRRVADDCGFCDRPLGEDPLVGVEYYRCGADHDGFGPYANYAVCGRCVPVFGEFLAQVRAGRSD